MPENHLFEYAVIRVVPRVEREEFLNVGVIVYCSPLRFLQTRYELDASRLLAFCSKLDLAELDERLQAFKEICAGAPAGGPIGKLPLSGRFRWLTATRSTIVQTSPVHPGLLHDAAITLDRLFEQLVQQGNCQ
jgi:hypothetical protein